MKINKKIALRLCSAPLSSLLVIAGTYCVPAITHASTPVVDLSQDLQPSVPINMHTQALNSATSQYAQNSQYIPAQSADTDTITTEEPTEQPNIPAPAHGESSLNTMDEPVPSSMTEGNTNSNFSSMPTEQRLQRLEQQLQNFANMNFPQQISQLQQQIQQLNGQLQQQSHQLQVMSTKLNQLKTHAHPIENSTISTTTQPAVPTIVQPTNVTTNNDLSAGDTAYQQAINLLNNKQYSQAESAFKQYVQHYPQGKFTANAHYWLGELYLLDKNLLSAANEFSTVIQKPGTSGKAADAQLKLATIHLQQGQTQTARNEFKEIQHNYPGTTAAHLADIQLQQLNIAN